LASDLHQQVPINSKFKVQFIYLKLHMRTRVSPHVR